MHCAATHGARPPRWVPRPSRSTALRRCFVVSWLGSLSFGMTAEERCMGLPSRMADTGAVAAVESCPPVASSFVRRGDSVFGQQLKAPSASGDCDCWAARLCVDALRSLAWWHVLMPSSRRLVLLCERSQRLPCERLHCRDTRSRCREASLCSTSSIVLLFHLRSCCWLGAL